jgi:hypothetical protein
MKALKVLSLVVLLMVAAALIACSAPAATPTPATYTDPFAYCAAVGTIDQPGANYTGAKVPESVAQALLTALGGPSTPLDALQNGSFWRCMNGKVYGCFVGANLPCEEKADTNRTPTQAETEFCSQNRDSDFIPAVVTGRATVFEWRCTNGVPEVVKQFVQPDAQGFLSNVWYQLSKP